MRNGISNRTKTTWPNTDNRLNSDEFYEPGINRQIDIQELGWVDALNDFMEHLSQSGELKREEGANEAITDLKSLMCGRRIGNNSPGNLKIAGSAAENIESDDLWKRKSMVCLEIGMAKKALIDFAK